MDLSKVTFPVVIGAAVIGIWAAFRNTSPTVGAVAPNPASSGVTLPFSSGGVVQPVNYNVAPLQLSPSPFDLLSQPNSTTPGAPANGQQNGPPAYMAFNFGPALDLTKRAPDSTAANTGGCGCKSKSDCASCDGSTFGDGSGKTALASSGAKLVNNSQPGKWLNTVEDNFNSYLATAGIYDNSASIH